MGKYYQGFIDGCSVAVGAGGSLGITTTVGLAGLITGSVAVGAGTSVGNGVTVGRGGEVGLMTGCTVGVGYGVILVDNVGV